MDTSLKKKRIICGEQKRCPTCDKSIQAKYFPQHMKQHNAIIECSKCNFKADQRFKLRRHLLEEHNENILVTNAIANKTCKECDFTTSREDFLNLHQSKNHEIVFKCEDCSYEGKTLSHVKEHKNAIHVNKINCNLCNKVISKYSLKMHLLSHDEHKKIFKCTMCEKEFGHPMSLKNHKETVHDRLRFECNQCSYQATQKSHLKTHKQSIHQGVKYPCDICQKEFKQKQHLKTHKDGFHKMGKLYKCTQCDYSTNLNGSLTMHIKSLHEGIRYKCNLCDHQATQPQSLKLHKRKHHGKGLFKCEQCGDEFVTSSKLKMHLKIVHQINTKEKRIGKN